jgi:uncharacterized cofD-like protein
MQPADLAALATELEEQLLGLDPTGPRVVAIGGGHGLAAALVAVQSYASEITAIVSVADDGGSSGRLTSGLGIPPPGDIRRCLLALTPEPTIWSELFTYRFGDDVDIDPADMTPRDVEGHSLGNLILAALADIHGDFALAVRLAGDLLGSLGVVVPAADRPIHLTAECEDGVKDGQVAVARTSSRVRKMMLGPEGIAAHPSAVTAIGNADQIILGPGSLFTSVLASLAVPGIAEAIEMSPAQIVSVVNLVTQDGETLGLSGRDHLEAFERFTGLSRRGEALVHSGALEVPPTVSRVMIDDPIGWTVHFFDVANQRAAWPEHDPIKLGTALAEVYRSG